MGLEIKTEIKINAPLEKVWQILINFEAYPSWNPFIKWIKGQTVVGQKLSVRIEPPQARGMTFSPVLLSFEKEKELSWLGHLFFPGLFDGWHKFELLKDEDGMTRFIQNEKFNGILVPFFKNKLKSNTKDGFVLMNKKLKILAEIV